MYNAAMRFAPREKELYQMALEQGGLFTLDQAKRFGFGPKEAWYRVRTGRWERLGRGIYRLAFAPLSPDEDLIRIVLWAKNPLGLVAFSHETALVIHGLGDLLPDRHHLTVPKGFARSAPRGVVLHRADLAHEDVEARPGFQVTTPLRTLLDVARTSRVPQEQLELAVRQALERGLVRRRRLDEVLPGLPVRARRRLIRALRVAEREPVQA